MKEHRILLFAAFCTLPCLTPSTNAKDAYLRQTFSNGQAEFVANAFLPYKVPQSGLSI
jgi:hypothetical protein